MHKLQGEIFHEEKRNKLFLRISGTRGREIWRTHHRKQRKGTVTMEREGLDSMAWTEGQEVWRAGREEKSKPGAENLRLTAWRTDCGGRHGAEAEGGLKGLHRVSAAAFLAPGTWMISLVIRDKS